MIERLRVDSFAPAEGIGGSVGGRFAAVYIDPESHDVIVQVGARRVLLDDGVSASYRQSLGGLRAHLSVRSDGREVMELHSLTPARFLLRRADPAYDELDESNDDLLMDIADIINSDVRREAFRSARDEWRRAQGAA